MSHVGNLKGNTPVNELRISWDSIEGLDNQQGDQVEHIRNVIADTMLHQRLIEPMKLADFDVRSALVKIMGEGFVVSDEDAKNAPQIALTALAHNLEKLETDYKTILTSSGRDATTAAAQLESDKKQISTMLLYSNNSSIQI